MTDTYRAELIKAVRDMRREQVRQEVSNMSNEEVNNVICDSLGVPRGTQFTVEQLEMLIESHEMRRQERLQAVNH
jgi:hypothetical protein